MKVMMARKNQPAISKDFLNQIRSQRINDVKEFKKKNQTLLDSLKGITSRKKTERYVALNNTGLDLQTETKQNNRILGYLLTDMEKLESMLQKHGVDEKIINDEEKKKAEMIQESLDYEEQQILIQKELKNKIKDITIGGMGKNRKMFILG